jgi:hypothetical protein
VPGHSRSKNGVAPLANGRASKGDEPMGERNGRASFEARKGSHLKMTGLRRSR